MLSINEVRKYFKKFENLLILIYLFINFIFKKFENLFTTKEYKDTYVSKDTLFNIFYVIAIN